MRSEKPAGLFQPVLIPLDSPIIFHLGRLPPVPLGHGPCTVIGCRSLLGACDQCPLPLIRVMLSVRTVVSTISTSTVDASIRRPTVARVEKRLDPDSFASIFVLCHNCYDV
jgi:hypothetical protein